MITIDGIDIKKRWRLEPMEGGFYDSIMQYHDLKERIAQDFKDVNGVVVSLTAPKAKAREINLSFICDGYAYADDFVNYLLSKSFVILEDIGYTEDALKIQYLGCTDLNYFPNYLTFTIKFREVNPANKINIGVFNESYNESYEK